MKFLEITLNKILFLFSLKSTKSPYEIKYLSIQTISILFLIILESAEGHKLLETSSSDNIKFEDSLTIPNHTISWAIYQKLESNISNARFYKFENNRFNNSFYAQVSIPKIEKYEEFNPSLVILEPLLNKDNKSNSRIENHFNFTNYNNLPLKIPNNYKVLLSAAYQGLHSSTTFYEPFTQTNYWERQEIRIHLQHIGTYYIIVYNEKNDTLTAGKFTLAVGEVEDFSILDLFIQIPYTWIKLKFFFEDYLAISIVTIIFISLTILLFILLKKVKDKK